MKQSGLETRRNCAHTHVSEEDAAGRCIDIDTCAGINLPAVFVPTSMVWYGMVSSKRCKVL